MFEQHRGLLFSIAYRMLGSVADAEDALQDAYIRWQQASDADVRSPKAFLITIVSRLCINQLTSARVRREEYVGEWLPEPIVTEPGSATSEMLEVDESVSMALLLMLERLTPVERAVFLLSEVFDYKHADIASTLGLSKANCRQLLRRARLKVHRGRTRFNASIEDHTDLLARFLQAAASGDMNGLLALLSTNVALRSDGGGKAPALPHPIYGAEIIARTITHGLRKLVSQNVLQRIVRINGEPGIVSYLDGHPQSAFVLHVREGRIEVIYIVTNPEKLSHLPPQLHSLTRKTAAHHAPREDALYDPRSPLTTLRLWFGPIAALLLLVGILAIGSMIPGYSHVRQTVSELGEVGSPGRVAFSVLLLLVAACLIAFAGGVAHTLRGAGYATLPAYFVGAMAISAAGVGIFSFPHPLHNVFGMSELVGYQSPLVAALVCRKGLSASKLVTFSIVMYALILVALAANMASMDRHGDLWTHIQPFYGIVQRSLFAAWFVWCAGYAVLLMRLGRERPA